MSKTKLTALRGMNDLLPADAPLWETFEAKVFEWLGAYGYRQIRTPLLEMTELFVKGIGEVTDVVEHEKEYLVKIDLPEVKKDDVKVLFDDGVLTVKGERKVEKEVKGETVHRTERFYGSFERSFTLPDDVDPKLIRAEAETLSIAPKRVTSAVM